MFGVELAFLVVARPGRRDYRTAAGGGYLRDGPDLALPLHDLWPVFEVHAFAWIVSFANCSACKFEVITDSGDRV